MLHLYLAFRVKQDTVSGLYKVHLHSLHSNNVYLLYIFIFPGERYRLKGTKYVICLALQKDLYLIPILLLLIPLPRHTSSLNPSCGRKKKKNMPLILHPFTTDCHSFRIMFSYIHSNKEKYRLVPLFLWTVCTGTDPKDLQKYISMYMFHSFLLYTSISTTTPLKKFLLKKKNVSIPASALSHFSSEVVLLV